MSPKQTAMQKATPDHKSINTSRHPEIKSRTANGVKCDKVYIQGYRFRLKEGKRSGVRSGSCSCSCRLKRAGCAVLLLQLVQSGVLGEVPDRLRCNYLIKTISATPVLRLASDKGADGAKVAFVAEEVRLLFALGPEADGVGEGVHGLAMAADEGAAEVDVLDFVLF